MNKYSDINGVTFTDADVARWADEAEAGFPNSTLVQDKAVWVQTDPMETHSVRVPASLWAQVTLLARERNISASQYIRETLAQSIAE